DRSMRPKTKSKNSARSRLERAEHDDVDRVAGRDGGVGRDDREPVGEHHRGQDGRALLARQTRAVAVAGRGEGGGQEAASPARGLARGARAGAGSRGGSIVAAPAIRRSAGRRKSSKVTIAETGLPGSPKTGRSPRVPNVIGLPGRIDTCHRWSLAPPRSSASR